MSGPGVGPGVSTPCALTARGLHKRFGGLTVADNIHLSLPAGARHALIGPNGAGKTTLVGLLTGLLRADSGQIWLGSTDVTRLSPQARVKHGLVRTFQVNSLFPSLTVRQNVELALCEHAGTSRSMLRSIGSLTHLAERALATLAQVGLEHEAGQRVSELAYGPQRLLEIALALALEPRVLLLDEPAAGVASADAERMMSAIERLPCDIAILMIEHDMRIVRRFAQTVTVLVAGQVLATDTPEAIMTSEAVRRVYLGSGGQARYGHGS